MPSRPATLAPPPLATLVLDPEVLRQALVAALSDPSVVERLALAIHGNAAVSAGLPTFMNVREYAIHARMSVRSLGYARSSMTEGVHFSRNGRRFRYHVSAADKLLAEQGRSKPSAEAVETDLKALARQEAAKRRPKTRTEAPQSDEP